MGVPTTFPPRKVNGILISGFLSPDLKRATYPPAIASELESLGYLIDIDAWQARKNRQKFLDEIFLALNRRAEAMFKYYAQESWDLFVAHFMGYRSAAPLSLGRCRAREMRRTPRGSIGFTRG